jgi:hypothetical protein
MSPVGTLTRPSSLRPSVYQAGGVGLLVIIAVLVMGAALALVHGPKFVDHVTFDNRSNLEVHVVARGADGDPALGLAVVDPDQRTRLDEVLDQGDTWRFQLSRGRSDLGVITLTRAELAAAGWNVVIPASLGRR